MATVLKQEGFIMNKRIEVEGMGIVDVRIYPEAQLTINKGWESLYFSENRTVFAEIEWACHLLSLETDGDVRLNKNNLSLKNSDQSIIRNIIDNSELEDWDVGNNNWFCLNFSKYRRIDFDTTVHGEHIVDCVFEHCPKSISDLEKTLGDIAYELKID